MPTTPRSRRGKIYRPGRDTTPPPHTSNPQATAPAEATYTQVEQAASFTWLVLGLLIALCLGALASFSLAPSLLASAFPTTTANEQDNAGGCTTKPTAILYLQGQHTTAPPSSWIHAGKNAQQFALAQACAAAFTITYESIDIDDATTLTAATSMLSNTGKTHFFQNSGAQPKDARLTSDWQLHARQVHLQQNAQVVSEAQLQTINSKTPIFSASFIVRYKLTTHSAGTSTIQYKQLILLLQASSIASSDASTGWQVVDWYNAN